MSNYFKFLSLLFILFSPSTPTIIIILQIIIIQYSIPLIQFSVYLFEFNYFLHPIRFIKTTLLYQIYRFLPQLYSLKEIILFNCIIKLLIILLLLYLLLLLILVLVLVWL